MGTSHGHSISQDLAAKIPYMWKSMNSQFHLTPDNERLCSEVRPPRMITNLLRHFTRSVRIARRVLSGGV